MLLWTYAYDQGTTYVQLGSRDGDPVAFLEPLFVAYAGTERARNRADERCHPTLAARERLPPDLLSVCAGVDILLHEQKLIG